MKTIIIILAISFLCVTPTFGNKLTVKRAIETNQLFFKGGNEITTFNNIPNLVDCTLKIKITQDDGTVIEGTITMHGISRTKCWGMKIYNFFYKLFK